MVVENNVITKLGVLFVVEFSMLNKFVHKVFTQTCRLGFVMCELFVSIKQNLVKDYKVCENDHIAVLTIA